MQTGDKVAFRMDAGDRWSQVAVMNDTGVVVLLCECRRSGRCNVAGWGETGQRPTPWTRPSSRTLDHHHQRRSSLQNSSGAHTLSAVGKGMTATGS